MLRALLFTGVLLLPACTAPTLPSPTTQAQATRLLEPLTRCLEAALSAAIRTQTPEAARQQAQQTFAEQQALLLSAYARNSIQLQVQSQWTPDGAIQLQLQAQLADGRITAQAQRQARFTP
ncbi:MAG: hypothetical protein ACO1RX_12950 [Candidatus Sericytochromatia bacterium]